MSLIIFDPFLPFLDPPPTPLLLLPRYLPITLFPPFNFPSLTHFPPFPHVSLFLLFHLLPHLPISPFYPLTSFPTFPHLLLSLLFPLFPLLFIFPFFFPSFPHFSLSPFSPFQPFPIPQLSPSFPSSPFPLLIPQLLTTQKVSVEKMMRKKAESSFLCSKF